MGGYIVAIGGGARFGPVARFEDLILELADVPRPRFCFVPTAKAHEPERIDEFYAAFAIRDCEPSHLQLFGLPEEPAAQVEAQDVVYVGGGNTANLLALVGGARHRRSAESRLGARWRAGRLERGRELLVRGLDHGFVRAAPARAREGPRLPARQLLPALRR